MLYILRKIYSKSTQFLLMETGRFLYFRRIFPEKKK